MDDQYESYNYDYDKHMFSGKSGKGRSKKEAEMNTNRNDPGGHTRKTVSKLMNNHHNEISQRSASQAQQPNQSWTQEIPLDHSPDETFSSLLSSLFDH